jgi:hypothetical protein
MSCVAQGTFSKTLSSSSSDARNLGFIEPAGDKRSSAFLGLEEDFNKTSYSFSAEFINFAKLRMC